jgi:hypothetical protein
LSYALAAATWSVYRPAARGESHHSLVCAVRLWGGCTVHALWNQPSAWRGRMTDTLGKIPVAGNSVVVQQTQAYRYDAACRRSTSSPSTCSTQFHDGARVGSGSRPDRIRLLHMSQLFSSPLKLFIPTQTPEGPAIAVAWCGPNVVSIRFSVSSGGWHV